jgi:hypothetical protein
METLQRLAHRLGDPLAHGSLVMEFHLAFRGMNVHVHFRRIHFDKETANRVASFHERGVIPFEQGEIDASILHRAPVDKNTLVLPGRSGNTRRAHQPPYGKRCRRTGVFRLRIVNNRK